MPKALAVGSVALAVLATLGCSSLAPAASVTLNPVKDNTLIEFSTGEASNALGSLFSGRTLAMGGNRALRAVMAFNIAGSIPAGSTITAVTLVLRLELSNSGNQPHSLYALTADWGEGTSLSAGGLGSASTPNDATWIHRFFDTQFWTTPGGDFVGGASATQMVGFDAETDYQWSGPQMVSDVQAWLNNPAGNFGWILIGNEATTGTAKKFYSRHQKEPSIRPRLIIDYISSCPANIVLTGASANRVDVDDLLAVITFWGPCPSPPAACTGNIINTGSSANRVDVDDLLAVITSWGPCP